MPMRTETVFVTALSNFFLVLSHSYKSYILKSLVQTTLLKLSCVVCDRKYIFEKING